MPRSQPLALQKLNRKVRFDNKRYAEASENQRRVILAKELLSRMYLGTFKPVSGDWLTLDFKATQPQSADLQKVIQRQTVECTGCAIGGLMLAYIAINNGLRISDITGRVDDDPLMQDRLCISPGVYPLRHRMQEAFGDIQLQLIESAFERGIGAYQTRAGRFGPKNISPRDRLRLIMENIIANNGIFRYDLEPVWHGGWRRWRTPGYEYPL